MTAIGILTTALHLRRRKKCIRNQRGEERRGEEKGGEGRRGEYENACDCLRIKITDITYSISM
jgi:hypothetical protein